MLCLCALGAATDRLPASRKIRDRHFVSFCFFLVAVFVCGFCSSLYAWGFLCVFLCVQHLGLWGMVRIIIPLPCHEVHGFFECVYICFFNRTMCLSVAISFSLRISCTHGWNPLPRPIMPLTAPQQIPHIFPSNLHKRNTHAKLTTQHACLFAGTITRTLGRAPRRFPRRLPRRAPGGAPRRAFRRALRGAPTKSPQGSVVGARGRFLGGS